MADLENNDLLEEVYEELEETDDTEETTEQDFEESEDGEELPEEYKKLSQKDIDKIVEGRLKRERAKYSDYEEIVEALKDYGYQGSPAEIKEAVRNAVNQERKQKELYELEEEAEKFGTTPELLSEMRAIKKQLADIEAEKKASLDKQNAIQEQEVEFKKQVSKLTTTYPSVNMDELAKDKQFIKFVDRANPKLTLVEIYEDYMELKGEADKLAMEKAKSKVNRSTSSGRAKLEGTGGAYGLNAEQQKLAKENGMTYKEYSKRLSLIRR